MKRKKKKEENNERWLLTYSDLITLLMILFILLYAMSTVDQEKYKQLSNSLGGALGGGTSTIGEGNGILPGDDSILNSESQLVPENNPDSNSKTEESELNNESTEGTIKDSNQNTSSEASKDTSDDNQGITDKTNMEKLEANIDEIISEYDMGDDVGNTIKENGLVISFSDKLFFDVGETTLKDNMKKGLDQIAKVMNKIDNMILVEGHTDNIPIKNSQFSSNWQLSAIRAANVVQYLVEEGHVNGTRLSAIGYGENQPVASNETSEGRSRNRRIDIVVLYNSSN